MFNNRRPQDTHLDQCEQVVLHCQGYIQNMSFLFRLLLSLLWSDRHNGQAPQCPSGSRPSKYTCRQHAQDCPHCPPIANQWCSFVHLVEWGSAGRCGGGFHSCDSAFCSCDSPPCPTIKTAPCSTTKSICVFLSKARVLV